MVGGTQDLQMNSLLKITAGLRSRAETAFWDLQSLARRRHNLAILSEYEDRNLTARPVFVLGAPRCGSTLFYQAMIHTNRFCYLQNRMMRHRYSLADYTARCIHPDIDYRSDFQNAFGRTDGESGPHEGFPFWRRFYPRKIHDYIFEHTLDGDAVREIRCTIRFLADYFEAPFFSKNLEMSLRLRSLQKVFPDAVYIVLYRDPMSIAASILDARKRLMGNPDRWWSMRPSQYSELLTRPRHMQICFQIIHVYEAIHNDLANKDRALAVRYEDFCRQPMCEIDRAREFLDAQGLAVASTGADIHEPFEVRSRLVFSPQETAEMEETFSKFSDYFHLQ